MSSPFLRLQEGVSVLAVVYRLHSRVMTTRQRVVSPAPDEAVEILVSARPYQAPMIRASLCTPRPNL